MHMACGVDCSARDAAVAEAQKAVDFAQSQVDNMQACIEVYNNDINKLESIISSLEEEKMAKSLTHLDVEMTLKAKEKWSQN